MTVAGVLSPSVRPLDAHLHVLDLAANVYPWLGPQHGQLHATHSAEQALGELAAAGMDGAVLVQAEDSEAETRYLLEVAARHQVLRGVVGWVPLDAPDTAQALLAELSENPLFVGVRQLVHDDPRADLLDTTAARRTLGRVAAAGYPVDVPDAWPRHLDQVERLARDLPELVVVVDHLGKPPRGTAALAQWRRALARVAAHENTVAKVSGLHAAGQPYTADALREVWETALELFGPGRLLYGSDWPMTVGHGGYPRSHEVLVELVAELSPREQELVMGDNARTVYRLGPREGSR